MFELIKKRDGHLEEFDRLKIKNAIWKAAQAVNGTDEERSERLADEVVRLAEKRYGDRTPDVEGIQDLVEKVLIEAGHAKTAKAYILYREKRRGTREINALIGATIDMFGDELTFLLGSREIAGEGEGLEVYSEKSPIGAAITAIGLVAEIGDLGRFAHPRKLMGYLGLTPSEHSSGERTSRGSITKTGNAHARRLLTEAAWNYRFKARICKQAQIRQQDLSEPIRRMAWTAQLRLTQRYAALNARGLQANKACIAVARELAGFVWAIGMQAQREKVEST